MQIQKTIVKKVPALGSSSDGEKIALTVKGLLVGIIPIVIAISGTFGVNLDLTELNTLVDSVVNVIISVSLAVSAVMTAFGLARKVVNKFHKESQ